MKDKWISLTRANQTKANEVQTKRQTNQTRHTTRKKIPTLSPPLASRRQKGREDTYTQEVAQAENSSQSSPSDASAAGMVSSTSSSESVHL